MAARSPLPMRVFAQENSGKIGANANKLIAAASGELLAFISCDDEFVPRTFAKKIAMFAANSNLALVCESQITYVSEAGEPLNYGMRMKLDALQSPSAREILELEYSELHSFFIQGAVFKKSLIDSVGGFDEDMRFDDSVLRTKCLRELVRRGEGLDVGGQIDERGQIDGEQVGGRRLNLNNGGQFGENGRLDAQPSGAKSNAPTPSAPAQVRVLRQSSVLYRQHGENVSRRTLWILGGVIQYLARYWGHRDAPRALFGVIDEAFSHADTSADEKLAVFDVAPEYAAKILRRKDYAGLLRRAKGGFLPRKIGCFAVETSIKGGRKIRTLRLFGVVVARLDDGGAVARGLKAARAWVRGWRGRVRGG